MHKEKKEIPAQLLQPAVNQHLPALVSAPVVLYSGPIGMPQHKPIPQTQTAQPTQPSSPSPKTLQTPSDKPSKGTHQNKSSDKNVSKSGAKRIVKATYHGPLKLDSSSLSSATTLEIPQNQATEEKKKITKPDSEIPELFQAAQTDNSKQEETSDSGDIRKRRLELADLFKTMPHLMKKFTESSEPGEQLVVVQGDMKYYSFLKTFLQHVNQVFAFHGGPEKLLSMAQAGHLKKNAGLSVIIDLQGNVLSKKITHSSGHQPADSLILDAIEQANPFPPIPQHFNHKTVRVELVSMVH